MQGTLILLEVAHSFLASNVGCNPSSSWVNKLHINGLVGTTALSNQHDLTLHNDSQDNVFQ